MKEALLFGGGSIGRSFLAPLLLDAGYELTLVDIDETLIARLRERGEYPLVVRSSQGERTRMIRGFRCLSTREEEALLRRLARADLVVSSVGKAGLPGVCELLGKVLPEKKKPVDLILAENIREGAAFCRERILRGLPSGFPLAERLGVVETSIGKMVPRPTEQDRREDPLRVAAEPYNTLILDREGFLGTPPAGPDIKLVSPVRAWVDRKLFVHNLGHGAAAYLGGLRHPGREALWELLEDPALREEVRGVMREGAFPLLRAYPGVFTPEDLEAHIDDLIRRFRNRALGDPVLRVGRDLPRKLQRDDRIVGAARTALAQGLPCSRILEVYRAALAFGGRPGADEADRKVTELARREGAAGVFRRISLGGGEPEGPEEREILRLLERPAAPSAGVI